MIKAACATQKTPRSTPEQPDSGPSRQVPDRSQRVLVQQRNIPQHRVVGILHRVILAVPEQLAQHQVRVGVFPKPVKVAAKSPLQHPKHENRPQGHPRTDSIPIAIPPDPLLQEPEYRFPQFDIQVYVPQAAQKLGNVVSRPRVNLTASSGGRDLVSPASVVEALV